MNVQALPPEKGNHNLPEYEKAVKEFDWSSVEQVFSWSKTGKLNLAYEAIDRHAEGDKADKVALYYSDAKRDEQYTYAQMKALSNKAGNVLRDIGVKKGDRVFIFMPRSPELYFALLGTLKVGAIAGPLFEAFMEGAVRDRLEDSGAKVLITTPALLERVPVDDLPDLEKVLIVDEKANEEGPFLNFLKRFEQASDELEVEWLDHEDGMILHYTSGSTGKPKGILHVHHAMIQQYQTALWVLDLKEDDVYWCTADPGWVTGTSYGVFAPWLAGVTNVVRGGRFSRMTGTERWSAIM